MTLDEILEALGPAWKFANKTDEHGQFLRPDYRRGLDEAWTDICVAHATKVANLPKDPFPSLNVAMVRRNDGQGRHARKEV